MEQPKNHGRSREKNWTGQKARAQLVITQAPAQCFAKEKPTYREVAESIYCTALLQLSVVGHDIFEERLHGWLMEWLLLRWLSLLLHQQVGIKLTWMLHHLLLHTKRSTLKKTKRLGKIGEISLTDIFEPFIFEFSSFSSGRWRITVHQLIRLPGRQKT